MQKIVLIYFLLVEEPLTSENKPTPLLEGD